MEMQVLLFLLKAHRKFHQSNLVFKKLVFFVTVVKIRNLRIRLGTFVYKRVYSVCTGTGVAAQIVAEGAAVGVGLGTGE